MGLGDYLYIAGGSTGLRIVDISTLSAPAERGSYGGFYAISVYVVEYDGVPYAFVGTDPTTPDAGTVEIFDCSDPDNPSLVGRITLSGTIVFFDTWDAVDVVVDSGMNYAYIGERNVGVQIADLSSLH